MKPRMDRFFLGHSSFIHAIYEAFRGPQTANGMSQGHCSASHLIRPTHI